MLRRDAQDKREKYSVTVDWFSFGCCLFEFMYGISPFRTDKARRWGDFPKIEKADRDKAIDLAIQQMEPDYDENVFDPVIKDLISKLLIKDGKKRLGANGYQEICAHPWFAGKSNQQHNISYNCVEFKTRMKTMSIISSFDVLSFVSAIVFFDFFSILISFSLLLSLSLLLLLLLLSLSPSLSLSISPLVSLSPSLPLYFFHSHSHSLLLSLPFSLFISFFVSSSTQHRLLICFSHTL